MHRVKKTFLLSLFLGITLSLPTMLNAQVQFKGIDDNDTELLGKLRAPRMIRPGMPLLTIAPDARGGAMGDVGAASTPDIVSLNYNAAKYAFIDQDFGASLSYSPWLRQLINDINLTYLAGYYKINNRNIVAASLRYFSLGSITFYGLEAEDRGTFKPNEFAIDLAYVMKLSDNLSASVTGRYIRSDLTQGQNVENQPTHAANSGAADLGVYYQTSLGQQKYPDELALGAQISNLGAKISYSDGLDKLFLPANLRIGGRYTINPDEHNKVSFMLDINKLLVPTPPVCDSTGKVIKGRSSDVGVFQGVIQSFYDAPDGFKEEFQEMMFSLGLEYWYSNMVAGRAGYFYESKEKGGRQYVTLGAALRFNVLTLDISYLFATTQAGNALNKTLRLTLGFEMGKMSGKKN